MSTVDLTAVVRLLEKSILVKVVYTAVVMWIPVCIIHCDFVFRARPPDWGDSGACIFLERSLTILKNIFRNCRTNVYRLSDCDCATCTETSAYVLPYSSGRDTRKIIIIRNTHCLSNPKLYLINEWKREVRVLVC